MEIILLYIIISYILHMGMIIDEYTSLKQVPTILKVSLLFSPISILIILGMLLNSKIKQYEKDL